MELHMETGNTQSLIISNYAALHHFDETSSQETSSQDTSSSAETTSDTWYQNALAFKQSGNPYGFKLKPADISDDDWYKKLEDDFQSIKSKAMAIVNEYKAMGVADVFDRNAEQESNSYVTECAPADSADRWEIDNMDAILAKKVKNEGYVLTSDERECFQYAAACEWTRDNYKSNIAVETQNSKSEKGIILDTDA
jgi:hypothetical protein